MNWDKEISPSRLIKEINEVESNISKNQPEQECKTLLRSNRCNSDDPSECTICNLDNIHEKKFESFKKLRDTICSIANSNGFYVWSFTQQVIKDEKGKTIPFYCK